MKNTLIISLILLLFTMCKISFTQNLNKVQIRDTTFSFTIGSYYNEISKDSHNYSKTFSLKSGILHYDYDYNGYPDNEEEHKQKQLNDSSIDVIKAKLKEFSLYQNYKKAFPLEKNGLVTESGYSLIVTTDSAKYEIHLSGPRPMDIDDKVYESLSIFYYFINTLFEK
jgi:hypothetical protein